jgi:PAS domain-containing protein
MDVSMPELDGFELATMIRQHPRFQRTAIIFISAVHLTDLDRLKGYQHGAVDYISVPVIQELLRAKVRVFAELHRKTRQLEALNRDLEHRVFERTEELATQGRAAAAAQFQTGGKNQELDAIVSTAPGCHFQQDKRWLRVCQRSVLRIYRSSPGAGKRCQLADYVHPDDMRTQQRRAGQSPIRAVERYEAEYRLRSKDGDYRWFRARAVPIRTPAGKHR